MWKISEYWIHQLLTQLELTLVLLDNSKLIWCDKSHVRTLQHPKKWIVSWGGFNHQRSVIVKFLFKMHRKSHIVLVHISTQKFTTTIYYFYQPYYECGQPYEVLQYWLYTVVFVYTVYLYCIPVIFWYVLYLYCTQQLSQRIMILVCMYMNCICHLFCRNEHMPCVLVHLYVANKVYSCPCSTHQAN